MRRLTRLTLALLLVFTTLLGSRALFFMDSAPTWFWVVLAMDIALIGLVLVYCTWNRLTRLRAQNRKQNFRVAGSVLFHLGLLLVIMAGFYYSLFQYKAVMVITEGQTVVDTRENQMVLAEGPFKASDFAQTSLTLDEVRVEFFDPSLVEHLTARLRVTDLSSGEARTITTAINQPFEYQSRRAAIHKFGLAPMLVIRALEGKVLWRGFVNLDLIGGRADLFNWPLSGERVTVKPILKGTEITGFNMASDQGEVVGLELGRPSQEFLGYLIEVPSYRYWLSLVLTSTSGKGLVNLGLFVMAIGIMLRYIFVFKDVDYRANY